MADTTTSKLTDQDGDRVVVIHYEGDDRANGFYVTVTQDSVGGGPRTAGPFTAEQLRILAPAWHRSREYTTGGLVQTIPESFQRFMDEQDEQKRLGRLVQEVRDGDGHTAQVDGVLIAPCDTYGRTRAERAAGTPPYEELLNTHEHRTPDDVTDREVLVMLDALRCRLPGKTVGQHSALMVGRLRLGIAALSALRTEEEEAADTLTTLLHDLTDTDEFLRDRISPRDLGNALASRGARVPQDDQDDQDDDEPDCECLDCIEDTP